MISQTTITLRPFPRGIHLITSEILRQLPELPEAGLLNLLIKHTSTYREYKPVYDRYRKSADKEKFLRGQESKIILFESAAKALKQMGVQKLPDTAALKQEMTALTEEKPC